MSEPSSSRRTITETEFRSKSRRSFLIGLAGITSTGVGLRALANHTGDDDRIAGPLRSVHDFNGAIWQTLYSPDRLAPTFDPSEARPIRVNGRHGIREEIDLDMWELDVIGPDGSSIGTHTMDDIRALPFQELTIEHKCIEGWSEIVTWGGTTFANFAALYADAAEASIYVNMETPDREYYVSVDRDSMLHPQTLLAWELNGEPLSQNHGAPLRLATPLKYGIKQIKRISSIEFSNERGRDYWTERGYDWYSGL